MNMETEHTAAQCSVQDYSAKNDIDNVLDGKGAYAIPGLIDLHFHGCVGDDFCDGDKEAIRRIAEYEVSVGVTAIAPATMTLPVAELENILNEAAIIATVKKHEAITNKDIEDAVKKVTVGLEKHSRVISEKDKKLTAFHEAGHAIVSRYLETQKEIKEVSIIPRGVAGGYTMYKTNEDKF